VRRQVAKYEITMKLESVNEAGIPDGVVEAQYIIGNIGLLISGTIVTIPWIDAYSFQ